MCENSHSEILQHELTFLKKRGKMYPNVATNFLGTILVVANGRVQVVALRTSTARAGAVASGYPPTYRGIKDFLMRAGREQWLGMTTYKSALKTDDILVLPPGWMLALNIETPLAWFFQFPLAPANLSSAAELDILAEAIAGEEEGGMMIADRLNIFARSMRCRILGARPDDMEELD